MNNTVTVVFAVVLVITLLSEKCFSLETSDNVDVHSDDGKISSEDSSRFISVRYILNGGKDALDKSKWISKRVKRQAYQGQTPLYPSLPSGPPYGLEPYPNSNNQIVRPGYNNPAGPYGQKPQANQWQPTGQSNYNNPYGTTNYTQPNFPNSNGYKPTNFTNNPSGPYGQYPQQNQPNSWQPNGQQPNYNNAYGTNTQSGNNFTQPRYPVSNGYKPSNFSNNPSDLYGQSTPPNSWKNPYANNNGLITNGTNAHNPYPGIYQPPNTHNNPSGRPPYNEPRPSYNNSYPAYPSYTTTPKPYPNYPSQRTPYPGQSQINNNMRPGNQHSVVYDDSTKRPGQNPYNSYNNASNWFGNALNNTNGRPSYNPQNGQNPQYFNSYPGSSGQGQQNSTNPYNIHTQRPPYQDPYGQHSPTSYPGQSSDSATFNLANSGYKPSIPVRPPYGSPYGNGPYSSNSPNYFQYPNGTSHDPTRVSPQNFNSY